MRMGLQYYEWIKSGYFGICNDRYNYFRKDWCFVAVADWDYDITEAVQELEDSDIPAYEAYQKIMKWSETNPDNIGFGKTPMLAMADLEGKLMKYHEGISQ